MRIFTKLNLSHIETSPEFWQMSNMEYLQWGYGVCTYVLSIEYEHAIFEHIELNSELALINVAA